MNGKVCLVSTIDDAMELKRWLSKSREILAVDTETEGLHFSNHKLRLVQLGDKDTGWAIPAKDWRGFLRDILQSYEGPIVGHNLKFDLHFIKKYLDVELKTSQLHDTSLAARLIWPNESVALKNLAERFVDSKAKVGEIALEKFMNANKHTWATVPIDAPAYWAYAAMDVILTARLHSVTQKEIDARDLRKVYELECAVSGVLFQMEHRGVRVDVDYCEREHERLTDFVLASEKWAKTTYGVSLGSAAQVVLALQKDSVSFTSFTSKGNIRLDEEVLSKIIDHPLAAQTLKYRKALKIANTYLANFIEMADKNEMLHCNVRQMGAITGRMSVVDPALQTLPREQSIVKDAFVPIKTGNTLITADYSAMEMKMFAHYAQDRRMISRINEGVDLHTITAQAVYGLGSEPPTSQQRQVAKSANFTRIYGGGAKKFADTAKIDEIEAKSFYRRLDEEFPTAKIFMQTVESKARERLSSEGRAYVRTLGGRICETSEDKLYKLVNYVIQGSCADLLKQKLVELDNAGLGSQMILPIHDEVLLDVDAESSNEVKKILEQTMPVTDLSVVLDVEIDGPFARWGDKCRAKT